MRAVIVLVAKGLEHRFERALPPDHRIRAQRPGDRPDHYSEFIVEGSMMPEVKHDYFERADLQLSLHSPSSEGMIHVEARWRFYDPASQDERAASEAWTVARFPSMPELMEFLG